MFKVNNIKISVKLLSSIPLHKVIEICVKKGLKYCLYKNFVVFRKNGFTYTLFKKKLNCSLLIDCHKSPQHVNVSSISNNIEIKESLQVLSSLLSFDCSSLQYSTDTITANGDFGKALNLEEFILKNSDISDKITFNAEKFPGLFVAYKFSIKGIIFRSGKFVIVGARKIKDIEETQSWITSKIVNICQQQSTRMKVISNHMNPFIPN